MRVLLHLRPASKARGRGAGLPGTFLVRIAALLCMALLPPAAQAAPRPAEVAAICDAAAARASGESGVPLAVLRAITRTETGRRMEGALRPWPWTVNMEGKGVWFDSREAARDYALRHHARGARSFDTGCFQINYKWHGAAFDSIEQMFDPLANARYAAAFLARLHGELGSWSRAAGAYHSRTPTYAKRYRARFDRIRAALGGELEVPRTLAGRPGPEGPPGLPPGEDRAATQPAAPRQNRYPLLQAGGTAPAQMGSLFPGGAGEGQAWFAQTGPRLIQGPSPGAVPGRSGGAGAATWSGGSVGRAAPPPPDPGDPGGGRG